VHILVTDVLCCPRCGPGFTLILLADRVEARRVQAGTFGCANCRERFPIADGVADLTLPGEPSVEGEPPDTARIEQGEGENTEQAFRLLALLGIAEPPALVVLAGSFTRLGPALAQKIEGLEAVCINSGAPASPGVTRMHTGARLPLNTRSARGVALAGEAAERWLEEGARITSTLGRLVLESAPPDAPARLETAGFRILAAQHTTVVATRA
jgi:uncharacterized protein YbaR (Trm112 family)/ribosomal protein S16